MPTLLCGWYKWPFLWFAEQIHYGKFKSHNRYIPREWRNWNAKLPQTFTINSIYEYVCMLNSPAVFYFLPPKKCAHKLQNKVCSKCERISHKLHIYFSITSFLIPYSRCVPASFSKSFFSIYLAHYVQMYHCGWIPLSSCKHQIVFYKSNR